ncbi:hypothetical protein MKX03_002864 [Papaver bracteatum]|nr:hypothetical protein MKX03_002864 [Papaver bracteatum]
MVVFPVLVLHCSFILFLFLEISCAVDTIASNQSIIDNGKTLASSGGRFELGFFSPGNSRNRYIGIWFKDIPSTVLWVANRNNPITSSLGVLKMNSDGNIIIFSGTEDVIWSSNSSTTVKNPTAQLLDTGNFVLRDDKRESYIWQSFDYPCDSLIAGMKLGWSLKENRNWSMSSWKNADDPSPGDFTYKIKSTPVFDPMFVYHANEMYYMFEDIYPEKSRFVLNQTGSIDHLKWDDINQERVVVITLRRDSCDNYDPCGAHGTCNINNVPPCECLKGFTPKSPQQYSDAFNPSAGWKRFTKVKLPDNSQVLNTTNSCEKECLARCSCSAYAIKDVASCIVWLGDLHDIRSYNDGLSANIYVRMSANYLRDIHVESSNKKTKIIVSVVSGIFLLGLAAISFLIIRQKRRARRGGININNHDRDYNMNGSQEEDLELHAFHLATIETATNYFSFANKIGEGGFGPVYKVWKLWNEDKAIEVMNSNTPFPVPISQVLRCIHVGLLCVQQRPEDRPAMSMVVLMLGSDAMTLPQPKQPGFSSERFLTDTESSSREKKFHSGIELTITTIEGR